MPGTRTELASRLDLASLGDVAPQARGVLVVDLADLVDAEAADFFPSTEPASAASAWSTSTTARAASAGRAAPTTRAVAAAGTIATKGTITLRTRPESAARRVAVGSAPTWRSTRAAAHLTWSVVAHHILSFSTAIDFVNAHLYR